jgi:addiction module RelE/StbE family toxin
MKLRWDRRAITDLEAIYAYIAADNPKAAKRVVDRIEKSVSRLLFMPMSGRPGVKKGMRLLVVPRAPYIVVHRVRSKTVDILAVLHTARRRRS